MRARHPRFLASDPKFLGLSLPEIAWLAFALILSRCLELEVISFGILIIGGISARRIANQLELGRRIQKIKRTKKIKLEDLKRLST